MKLHWSPRSPFVRKVMIVLHEAGLMERVTCVRSVVAYAAPPNEDVLKDNPLGKIPTLVLDDGSSLFDSRVICEYLDGLHDGSKLFPADTQARMQQLCWQALGDGMTDILLMWRTEQMRPDGPSQVIVSALERKVRAIMARLEGGAGDLERMEFGIGHVAIICALGQLDFRFQDNHWRSAFPKLAAWHEKVSARPSVEATIPQDDPSPTTVSVAFDASKPPIDFLGVAQ